MPIIQVPNYGPVSFPANATPEDIKRDVEEIARLAEEKLTYKPDYRNLGLGQLAAGAFRRSVSGLGSTVTDLIPALAGSALGYKDYAAEQLAEAEEKQKKAELRDPTAFKSYKDVEGLGGGAGYVAETLGGLAPDIAAMLTGAGTGAVVGRRLATKGLEEVAKQTALRSAATMGAKVGTGAASFGLQAPETFKNIYEETGEQAPGTALFFGAIQASLDSVLPGRIIDQLGPAGRARIVAELANRSNIVPPSIKMGFAKEIAKTGAMEGGTEVLQEALGILAEQTAGAKGDFFSSKNVDRLIESGIKGTIGGTAFGAPGALSEASRAKQEATKALKEREAAPTIGPPASAAMATEAPQGPEPYKTATRVPVGEFGEGRSAEAYQPSLFGIETEAPRAEAPAAPAETEETAPTTALAAPAVPTEAPPIEPKPSAAAPAVLPASAEKTKPSYEPFAELENVQQLFRTERGSTYAQFNDNTTIRNRSGENHTDTTTGLQPKTSKTVFVDKAGSDLGGLFQNPDMATALLPVVDAKGDPTNRAQLVLTEDYGPKKAGTVVGAFTYSTKPKVGLYPVEIYSLTSPMGDTGGGIHFGNKIVEVKAPTGAPSTAFTEQGEFFGSPVKPTKEPTAAEITPKEVLAEVSALQRMGRTARRERGEAIEEPATQTVETAPATFTKQFTREQTTPQIARALIVKAKGSNLSAEDAAVLEQVIDRYPALVRASTAPNATVRPLEEVADWLYSTLTNVGSPESRQERRQEVEAVLDQYRRSAQSEPLATPQGTLFEGEGAAVSPMRAAAEKAKERAKPQGLLEQLEADTARGVPTKVVSEEADETTAVKTTGEPTARRAFADAAKRKEEQERAELLQRVRSGEVVTPTGAVVSRTVVRPQALKQAEDLEKNRLETEAKIAALRAEPENKELKKQITNLENKIAALTKSIDKMRASVRTALPTQAPLRAERAGQERAGREETDVTDEIAKIAETQTKERTGQVVRPVALPPRQFRAGTKESKEGKNVGGGKSTRPKDVRDLKQRDVSITKEEQEKANAEAIKMMAAKMAANRKMAKDMEEALAAEETGERANEDDYLREDNNAYDLRETTPLNDTTQEALKDGRLVDAVNELAENGSTPFVRQLAKTLAPLLLRTKVVVGQITQKGVPVEGIYSISKNEVGLHEDVLSEETTLHELVHAVTLALLKADPATLTKEQAAALAEIKNLFEAVKDSKAFSKEYGASSLEEFVSEVMTNKQLRDKLDASPSFLQRLYNAILRFLGVDTKAVSEKATEQIYALFQPSRKLVDPTTAASAMRGVFPATRPEAAASVDPSVVEFVSNTVKKEASIGDKLLAFTSGLYWRTAIADRWAPIEALLKLATSGGIGEGEKNRKINDLRALQTRVNMRLHEQTNQFVSTAALDGVPQIEEKDGIKLVEGRAGANLRAISQALSKAKVGNEQFTENLFQTWLMILRAERDGVGYSKMNFDNPPTAAEAAAIKAAVSKDPETKAAFEKARSLYAQYNKDLMKFLVDAGAIEKSKADELTSGDYVPFYRELKDGTVEMTLGTSKSFTIGSVAEQPYLKELVGGNTSVLPFFSGAMQNTAMLMRMGLRNLQAKDVANVLQDMGLAKVVPGEGPANVLRFKSKGKNYYAAFDTSAFPKDIPAELVMQGLQGIKTATPWLVKGMAIPANVLRKTITRMPLYAARQIVRDSTHAWLTTGGDFGPVLSSLKELPSMFKKESQTELTLERAGVISSNVFTGDVQDHARLLRDISSGKPGWQAAVAKLDEIALKADAATRVVMYDAFIRKGMTHAEALLGTLESMNFGRRGTSASMHWLSTMVPFFHSQIQGLDSTYRSLKGDMSFNDKMDARNTLLKRGAMVAAFTMGYALLMQDDEAYKNADPKDRAANWFIRIPGVSEAVRVPIPFELGLIFKAIPEAFINVAFGDTKATEATKALLKQAWLSNPFRLENLPTAVKGPIEIAANFNFFGDAPIESSRERALTSDQRYRNSTTEVAKLLGKAGVLSPLQIDHFVRSYTSSMGITLLSLADFALRPLNSDDVSTPPSKKLSQMAVIGSMFQPDTGRGLIDAAFDDIEKFQQAHNTYKALKDQGRANDAAEFANSFSNEMALNSAGGKFRQKMGELAKKKREIAGSPSMGAEEKRSLIDGIEQIEVALARRIRQQATQSE